MEEFDIKKYPLLRLALPLIAGIIIGWQCNAEVLHVATLFAVSVVLVFAGLCSSFPKWFFGLGAMGAMLAIGLFVITCDKKNGSPQWGDRKVPCVAQIIEVPRIMGAATKVAALVSVDDSARVEGERSEGFVDVYFANCVALETLQVGDKISFSAKIKNPLNRGNPAEFDAVRYMRVKGVTGSLFLPIDSWEKIGAGEKTLAMRALALRDKVVDMYERLGFEGDCLSLLSAFSVGEKRGFSHTLKEAYAAAGVSHLLALSGLHLGIFYMLLTVLFSFMGGTRSLFVARELLALCLLWAFAFVAGLTPSVVRSAVLFSLVGVGRLLQRDGAALNSLAFAAVLMLVVSPRLLFDVSFQLSFSAVAAILLLVPWLQRVLRYDAYGRAYKYVSSSVALSVSAQVGVLPFMWYYFGTFPLYFLFANIVLVPLATVLMLSAVLLWLSAPFALLQQGLAWPVSLLLSFMNGMVDFVASLPFASVLLPSMGVAGCLLVAFLVWALLGALAMRKYRLSLFVVAIIVLVSVLNFLAAKRADENFILLFNAKKAATVLVVADGGVSYACSSVPRLDSEYENIVKPYVTRERLDAPVWVENAFCDSVVSFDDGILSFDGLRVCLLADDCWRDDTLCRPVDALLLCRGFLGPVKELLLHYPTGCVVLDGSLYENSRERLLRECRQEGVGCVDVAQLGAVKIKSANDSFTVETMAGK